MRVACSPLYVSVVVDHYHHVFCIVSHNRDYKTKSQSITTFATYQHIHKHTIQTCVLKHTRPLEMVIAHTTTDTDATCIDFSHTPHPIQNHSMYPETYLRGRWSAWHHARQPLEVASHASVHSRRVRVSIRKVAQRSPSRCVHRRASWVTTPIETECVPSINFATSCNSNTGVIHGIGTIRHESTHNRALELCR